MKESVTDHLPLIRDLGVFLEDKFPELIAASGNGGSSGGGGFSIELPPPFDNGSSSEIRGPSMPMTHFAPKPYSMAHVLY